MLLMQNTRDVARTEIQNQTRDVIRVRRAPDAPQAARAPDAPDAPRADVGPVPRGGGRLIVDEQDGRTIFTVVQVPPQLAPLARTAQQTAIGVLGLLAAIVILGPFARMFARRLDRKHEMRATVDHNRALQEQVAHLQQSIDAMSVEVERIGESQRFQSKLLVEKKSGSAYST